MDVGRDGIPPIKNKRICKASCSISSTASIARMELTLKPLTEHIWLLPHNPDETAVQSSIGVITSQNRSVLIDAGNSPRLARKIKTELVRNNLPPVSRIIYTHHHWDHVYGACEFDVPVTAHRICKAILEAESKKPWGIERSEERRVGKRGKM